MSTIIECTDALRTRFEVFPVNSVGLAEPQIIPQPQIDPVTNSARLLRELSKSTVSSRTASFERIVSAEVINYNQAWIWYFSAIARRNKMSRFF